MSNYQSNGTDLDSIFQARTSTKIANVGFLNNGTDISNLYEPLANNQKVPNVNLQANGNDLSNLFMGNNGQYIITERVTTTRTNAWNGNIDTDVEIIFSSASQRTDFFTFGGRIIIEAELTGANQDKETDWANVFNAAGSIQIGKLNTYRNAPGTSVGSIGADDLTTAYQTIYQTTGSGAYSTNLYRIQARNINTFNMQVRVDIQDLSTGNVDELVTATTTVTFSERRHSSQPSIPLFSMGNFLQ